MRLGLQICRGGRPDDDGVDDDGGVDDHDCVDDDGDNTEDFSGIR